MTTATPERWPRPAAAYLRLAALSLATSATLGLLGAWPTQALAPAGGLAALLAGLGIALLAALVGLVPNVLAAWQAPQTRATALMAGMFIRLALTLGLLVTLLLCGGMAKLALAVWTVIGYISLLAVDTAGIVRLHTLARSGS